MSINQSVSGTPTPAAVEGESGKIPMEVEDNDRMEVEEAKDEAAPAAQPKDQPEELPLSDKANLINVALGYGPVSNLKQPLKGFTAEDEVQMIPVINSMSSKLFTIVQKMTDGQKRDIEATVKTKKGIIKLCEVPRAYLYHLNYLEGPIDADKNKSSKRAQHPFLPIVDETQFSEEKLRMTTVLDAGWKREVVMRSPCSTGRKTGDVYYYSPEGIKFRLAQHLATPFMVEGFSFAKVRISNNPDQEIVRKAYDWKSHPRPPVKGSSGKSKPSAPSKVEPSKVAPKPSTSSSKESPDNDTRPAATDEPVKAVPSCRRSIQPPKRCSGDAVLLLSKRSKPDEKHSIDVDKMHQYVESQKQLAKKSDHSTGGEAKQRGAPGRSKPEEIIPCSIRCLGMTGEVPNLPCTRCLCLYHAECLGLPLNLNYPNILCSNCEANPASTATASTAPPQELKNTMLIKKPIIGVSANAMKRGRGRPPARGLPQLSNRSLSLATLSSRTFKKIPSPSQHISSNMKMNPQMINKTPTQVYAQPHEKTVSITKRYPQSNATVVGKRFVILSKKSRPDLFPEIIMPIGNGSPSRVCYVGVRRPEPNRQLEHVANGGALNNVSEGASCKFSESPEG